MKEIGEFHGQRIPGRFIGISDSGLNRHSTFVLRHFHLFARGLSLFLGGFLLLNLFGCLFVRGFDANLWLVDLSWTSPWVARSFLLCSGLSLVGYAVRPPRSAWWRRLALGCVGLLGVLTLANTFNFYRLLSLNSITAGVPVPFSLLLASCLAAIFVSCWSLRFADRTQIASTALCLKPATCNLQLATHNLRPDGMPRWKEMLMVCTVCLAGVTAFPLAQMFCFGKSDYRRSATVAVVPGARVYADGRPSDALADRVRTACQLYRDGVVHKLVFSGGPGDGAIHETEGMQRLALSLGVKQEDIMLDRAGLNTQATVRNTAALFSQIRPQRVLVVSHFYHLPRMKLAYQRAGWDVFTVPAKEPYLLRQLPYNMAREVAALWVYYFRPLVGA